MGSSYRKPYLTYEQQVDLLESRNLTIGNRSHAMERLHRFGYYRLSAYWYIFRRIQKHHPNPRLIERADDFLDGYTFENVIDLYVFDKKLRVLLMDALERIEIGLRVDIAYTLGRRDPFAQHNPNVLHAWVSRIKPGESQTKFERWEENHRRMLARSKEEFVAHFRTKYGLPLPIWVDVEIWDFGMLSHFFSMLQIVDKETIAHRYEIPNWKVLESWLRTMNHVRNIAAHHSRLWNRNLVDQPKMPAGNSMPGFNHLIGDKVGISRVYSALCIVSHFMLLVSPEASWFKRLDDHLLLFPSIPNVGLGAMGFPNNWADTGVWRQAIQH